MSFSQLEADFQRKLRQYKSTYEDYLVEIKNQTGAYWNTEENVTISNKIESARIPFLTSPDITKAWSRPGAPRSSCQALWPKAPGAASPIGRSSRNSFPGIRHAIKASVQRAGALIAWKIDRPPASACPFWGQFVCHRAAISLCIPVLSALSCHHKKCHLRKVGREGKKRAMP